MCISVSIDLVFGHITALVRPVAGTCAKEAQLQIGRFAAIATVTGAVVVVVGFRATAIAYVSVLVNASQRVLSGGT